MKFTKLLILVCSFSILLNNCSSIGEAGKILRNEKRATIDEFLIKKKEPLTLPPDFTKIPKPNSIEDKAETEQNSFKKILKMSETKSGSNQTKSSSTEKSILNQIKK